MRIYRHIYNILTHTLLMRIAKAMTPGLLAIQHGALQGRNTTTLASNLLNNLHTQDGCVPVLDVAKAFPSVPRSMVTNIGKEAGAPETIIRMLGEMHQHTPHVLSVHRRDLPIRPTRGIKEGCPLAPHCSSYTTTSYGGRPWSGVLRPASTSLSTISLYVSPRQKHFCKLYTHYTRWST